MKLQLTGKSCLISQFHYTIYCVSIVDEISNYDLLYWTQTIISKDFGMHVNTNFSITNYWFISDRKKYVYIFTKIQQIAHHLCCCLSSKSLISLKQYVYIIVKNVPAFDHCPFFSTSCKTACQIYTLHCLSIKVLVLWGLKVSVNNWLVWSGLFGAFC